MNDCIRHKTHQCVKGKLHRYFNTCSMHILIQLYHITDKTIAHALLVS